MPNPETTSSNAEEKVPDQCPAPVEGKPTTVPSRDAVGLLKSLRGRLLVAVTCGVLAAAVVGTVVWFTLPPGQHVAYAKMHMPKKPEGVL